MARTTTGIAVPLRYGRLTLGTRMPTPEWRPISAGMQTLENRTTLSQDIPRHQRMGQ